MNWLHEFAKRIRMLLDRRQFEADLEEEMRLHLELREQEQVASGMNTDDARAAARRRFGNATYLKEESHIAWGWEWFEHLAADIRYGLRMLRRSPGFTAIAVLTIALGIGATTAIFSVVDATLLHPLPYPQPEQLVSIVDDLPGVGAQDVGMSVPEWHDLERSGIFQHVSPMGGGGSVNLTGSSEPTRAQFNAVPPNYFALLGAKPELGRAFDPGDETPGFTLEVMISDGLWKRVRLRPENSRKEFAARQRLVPGRRRHTEWFSRPGSYNRGTENRSLGRDGFCRRACSSAVAQGTLACGGNRTAPAWADDCAGAKPG